MMKIGIFLLALISTVTCKELCYENYGCFADKNSFGLPDEPQKINTSFYLYTRANRKEPDHIFHSIEDSNFDKDLPNKFIIHGFRGNSTKSWVLSMKEEILKEENVNAFIVDWNSNRGFKYKKAASNTQIVGQDVAKFCLYLVEKGAVLKDFHLIGYSLGAHIAGYAGNIVKGIGRISGLDPASFYFRDAEKSVKLDANDAEFVDVIHTDVSSRLGFGLKEAMGHVDFYPNGGKNQPGCSHSNLKLFRAAWSWVTDSEKEALNKLRCSHSFAKKLFIDSIQRNDCSYNAYQCTDYKHFRKGQCLQCPENDCNKMGYWASKDKQLGTVYLKTKSIKESSNFCKHHYRVDLFSNGLDEMDKAKGKFKIYFETGDRVSETLLIKESSLKLVKNMKTTVLFDSEHLFNEIETVYVSYKRTSNYLIKWRYDQYWSFDKVRLVIGQSQKELSFCPVDLMIKSGTTQEFKKCSD